MTAATNTRSGFLRGALIPVLFIGIVHGAWWWLGDTMVHGGGLADGDSYTHLIRAARLWETGAWYDVWLPGINAPFGATVHWTRLFDVLLLGIAAPLTLVLGTDDALFVAGALFSPLAHVVLGFAVVWALHPLLGRAGAVLAGALTATQFGILAFAIAGRADHHMLFAVFAVVVLGFLVRAEIDGEDTKAGLGAGAGLAAGVWVGPEFLLFAVMCFAGFGLLWVWDRHGAAMANRSLARGFAVSLMVMTLIERGLGILDAAFDRLSIIHVWMGLLVWLIWELVGVLDRRRVPRHVFSRFFLLSAAACAAGLAVLVVFPDVLRNPLTRENPEIVPIFAHISEYGAVADAAQFLIYFGTSIVVLPWMAWRLRNAWYDRVTAVWLIAAAGALVFTAVGVSWIRWSLYAAVFMIPFLAALVEWLDGHLDRRFRLPWRVPIKVLVLCGIIIGPLGVAGGLRYAASPVGEDAVAKTQLCPLDELAKVLAGPAWAARPHVIVASANFGPELVYRTHHHAVASVHHRNIAGILDGHRVLADANMDRSRAIMETRGVDLIVLCPRSRHDGYFVNGALGDTLYKRLERGALPPGFREITLPETTKDLRLIQRDWRR